MPCMKTLAKCKYIYIFFSTKYASETWTYCKIVMQLVELVILGDLVFGNENYSQDLMIE